MAQKGLPLPPDQLIDQDGNVRYGNFAGPIPEMNFDGFEYRDLHRWPWTTSASLAKGLLKRWQFVGAMDENYIVGAAVVDLSYVGSGFAYVFDRAKNTIIEKSMKFPLAKNTQFSDSASKGASEIGSGEKHIRLNNTPTNTGREMYFRFGDELGAQINYTEPGSGVSTSSRQAMYGFHYTYKSAGLPAAGEITINGQKYQLAKNALALYDWSAATPPRITMWNWAAGMGYDDDGNTVGINFSTGLVTSGWTQNCVWLDGKPHMLGGINFDYDQKNLLTKPWSVSTPDKTLDLTFHPEKERYENVNFGFIISSFHQPFGKFEGVITLGKKKLKVTLFGFCEEHYAKW